MSVRFGWLQNKHSEVKSEVVELSLNIEIDDDLADALDADELTFLGAPEFEWAIQNEETSDGKTPC